MRSFRLRSLGWYVVSVVMTVRTVVQMGVDPWPITLATLFVALGALGAAVAATPIVHPTLSAVPPGTDTDGGQDALQPPQQ